MSEEREVQFLGKIYKCPNCGTQLESFRAFCPACGFEIREIGATNSINDFINELSKISGINEKASFIANYHVQNTKEDILEFLIFANKQIVNYDKNGDGELQEEEMKLAKAYKVLADDCYERAKALGISDNRIEEVYGRIKSVDGFLTKTMAKEKKNASISETRKSFQSSKVLKIDIALVLVLIVGFLVAKIFGSTIALVFIILAFLLCLTSVLVGFSVLRIVRSSTSVIFLILSLVLTGCSAYFLSNIDYKGRIQELKYGQYIEWDALGLLSKYVPKFEAKNGVLYSDTNDLLQFGLEYESNKEFDSWVKKIKDKGFTIEDEGNGRNYKAFNQDGYFAKLVRGDKYIETTIYAPFAWNDLILSNFIPVGYFYSGNIIVNTDGTFNVKLKYSVDSYIDEYINSCIDFGYNINVIQSKNSFVGYKKDGTRLSVSCDKDDVDIRLQKSFAWSELLLSTDFPQIYESNGKVVINEKYRNTVSFDKASASCFETYTKQCQGSGYCYNIFNNTDYFRATKVNNILIVIQNSNRLEASVISSTYEWPTDNMSSAIPPMEGIGGIVYGSLTKDEKTSLEASVYGISKDEIENYIIKCKEKGFTTDVVDNDTMFKATWDRIWPASDVILTISYDSFDHIVIKVEK